MTTTIDAGSVWLGADDCRIDDFVALVEQTTDPDAYPFADLIEQHVPIYDCERLRQHLGEPGGRRAVQTEIVRVLLDGPGLAVFRNAIVDHSIVDRASDAYYELIAQQQREGRAAGDHYAKPGANDRVWNALEKLALGWPAVFGDYYANDIIALVSTAWLGPAYQVTSQVNVVNPGGAAQSPHRDYHIGFLTDHDAEQYPLHAHRLSPVLTLQGAIAHCDMPVETGPTTYLPYSQRYDAGFLAWRNPAFIDYFEAHRVQLPMETGDAVFLSPALFHAAGHNRTTDRKRMVNLLQVSSAFGRAMESVDRAQMSNVLFPTLLEMYRSGDESSVRNVIAASAEGYAFPSNLDFEQPIGGLAPPSQADHVWRAVVEGWTPEALAAELDAHARRRLTHA